jgi:hypothetical protein
VPIKSQHEDTIRIIDGCETSVVLRKQTDKVSYVGDYLIIGLVKEETKELITSHGLKVQRYRIS